MSVAVAAPTEAPALVARRPFFSFHLALAALLAVMVYLFCTKSVADPDIWWHLKNAQYLVAQHKMITTDMFSYTLAGTPWLNHEWLAELPFYAAWRLWDLRGLYLLYTILVEAILLGTFYLAYRESENVKDAFLVGCLTVVFAVVNFGPRAILFGWGSMVILLLILQRLRQKGNARLWLLPPLFCLWANCHGSWLIGLFVFGVISACGLIEVRWGQIESTRWTPKQLRALVAAGLGSVAALFVNPYGYHLVLYPFELASKQKLMVEHIEEWASVTFHEPRGLIVMGLIFALLILALLSRQSWRLDEVILTLFALYASLRYVRFLFLAALLLAPILTKHLKFSPPYRPEIDKRYLNAAIVIAVLTIMAFRFPSQEVLQSDLNAKFPLGATHYLLSRTNAQRVFNSYMWGGYLIWNTPKLRPFIDSRTDIFEYQGIFKDYLDCIGLKDTLAILDRQRIDYVLFPPGDAMSYLLRNTARWKPVYEDKTAVVFERAAATSN